jgi:hypothetical protein
MKKREFSLRVLIVVGLIVAFTSLVFWRQHVVQAKRDQTVISTIAEWNRNGKPIIVQKIAPQDVKIYEKITITPLSKTLFEGYVTRRLIAGQTVYVDIEQGNRVFGVIRYVGQGINVNTGMFQVRVVFNHEVVLNNHIIVAYVHTGTLNNVISVPSEIIDDCDGKFFIWTVQDGRARKLNMRLGERNDYGAVVLQGLHDGDMVVIQGQTQLSDGDKVRIVDNKEPERHIP